jgi:hypothetical protein
MSELRSKLERTAERFQPSSDRLEGTMARVRRRRRVRRTMSVITAFVVFVAAFAGLWAAFRPGERGTPAEAPACVRTWAVPEPAAAPSGLTAVSALAPDDVWAVGPDDFLRPGSETIVEHFDGAGWERLPSPNAAAGPEAVNELKGVVAISPDDVWAVGDYATGEPVGPTIVPRALIEHWDGTRWSIVPAPNPNPSETVLNAVAAAAPDDVWAVGHGTSGPVATALIEHWDGTRWSIVPSPDLTSDGSGAELSAVTVVSASDVWVVGSQPSGALVEHWDGTSWTVADVPQPHDEAFLMDADASAPDDVWAVGWTTTSTMETPPTPPVVEHFDGTGWELMELPNPEDGYVVPLAVVAVSSRDVWIVGWAAASNEAKDYPKTRALVVRWDGSTWNLVDVGISAPPQILVGASDAPGGDVWLVGRQGGDYGGGQTSWIVDDRPLVVEGTCSQG